MRTYTPPEHRLSSTLAGLEGHSVDDNLAGGSRATCRGRARTLQAEWQRRGRGVDSARQLALLDLASASDSSALCSGERFEDGICDGLGFAPQNEVIGVEQSHVLDMRGDPLAVRFRNQGI